MRDNFVSSRGIPTYVVDHQTSDDVARALVEGGQQQAFYTFSMDEAYRRCQYFKLMMPRVKIFYAVKSNDTDMMLRLVAALGFGFDCSSPGEIYKIRKLGVHTRNIIFAQPCKSPDEMEYAQSTGVEYTTFDSSCELQKLRKSWPDAKLLIRIQVNGKAKIKLGLKFGCDFETEAIGLLDQAASFGLTVVGVAFHVGSLCYSPESYVVGLRRARALFDHEASRGRRMDIVDIGGGFLSNRTDSIDDVSRLINDAVQELFPEPTVQVFAEPGGYLCDSAFKMFCSIVGTRQVTENGASVNMIYLNNGIHGTLRFDENWHTLSIFKRSANTISDVEEETIVWGPTCNSLDRILLHKSVLLPRCAPGDWLAVDHHGAYTLCFSTRFSGMEAPLIQSFVSKQLWNCIKSSPVFQPSHFVLDPDISAPLPSTLPPVLPTCIIYEHPEM